MFKVYTVQIAVKYILENSVISMCKHASLMNYQKLLTNDNKLFEV